MTVFWVIFLKIVLGFNENCDDLSLSENEVCKNLCFDDYTNCAIGKS